MNRASRARPLHARCAVGGKRASNSEVSQRAAGGASMLFQHIAWSQSALMRCRARCACSAYATSSEFDAFCRFGFRPLHERWPMSEAALGRGVFRAMPVGQVAGASASTITRHAWRILRRPFGFKPTSKKMTCGITKKYSQNSIMTSKNYPMTIIDCHRIISYSGRSGIWPILTRNGGILV